jgi:hypothetical protein
VADTLATKGTGHCRKTRRSTEVFPAPEGPETITSLPRPFADITTRRFRYS